MDVWVAYIRNTEVTNIHESMILVGAFSSYDAAFDAVKARLNEMEPDGEFSYEKINKEGESYLYMEKGLHVKIVKLRVGQAQLGGKLRRVRNRSSKRKRHSRRH